MDNNNSNTLEALDVIQASLKEGDIEDLMRFMSSSDGAQEWVNQPQESDQKKPIPLNKVVEMIAVIKNSDKYKDAVKSAVDSFGQEFLKLWEDKIRGHSNITLELLELLPQEVSTKEVKDMEQLENSIADVEKLPSKLAAVMQKYTEAAQPQPQDKESAEESEDIPAAKETSEKDIEDNLLSLYLKKCWGGELPAACKLINEVFLKDGEMTKSRFIELNHMIYNTITEALGSTCIALCKNPDAITIGITNTELCGIKGPYSIIGSYISKGFDTFRVSSIELGINGKDFCSFTDPMSCVDTHMGVAHTYIMGRDKHGLADFKLLVGYFNYESCDTDIRSNNYTNLDKAHVFMSDLALNAQLSGGVKPLNIKERHRSMSTANLDNTSAMKDINEYVKSLIENKIKEILLEVVRPDNALEDLVNIFLALYCESCSLSSYYGISQDAFPEEYEATHRIVPVFQGKFRMPVEALEGDTNQYATRNDLAKAIIGLLICPVDRIKVGNAKVTATRHLDKVSALVHIPQHVLRLAALLFGKLFYATFVYQRQTSGGNDNYITGAMLGTFFSKEFGQDNVDTPLYSILKGTIHSISDAIQEEVLTGKKVSSSYRGIVKKLIIAEAEEMLLTMPRITVNALVSFINYAEHGLKLIGLKAASEIAASDLVKSNRKYRVIFGLSPELIHTVVQQTRKEAGWNDLISVGVPFSYLISSTSFKNWGYEEDPTLFASTDPETEGCRPIRTVYGYADDRHKDCMIDQMFRYSKAPIYDFTKISTAVLNSIGILLKFQDKVEQYSNVILTSIEQREELFQDYEKGLEAKELTKELIKLKVPNLKSKRVLILCDISNVKQFNPSLGGVMSKQIRAELEAHFRKCRDLASDTYYVVSSRRPLTVEELPNPDNDWETLECSLSDMPRQMQSEADSECRLVHMFDEDGCGGEINLDKTRARLFFDSMGYGVVQDTGRLLEHNKISERMTNAVKSIIRNSINDISPEVQDDFTSGSRGMQAVQIAKYRGCHRDRILGGQSIFINKGCIYKNLPYITYITGWAPCDEENSKSKINNSAQIFRSPVFSNDIVENNTAFERGEIRKCGLTVDNYIATSIDSRYMGSSIPVETGLALSRLVKSDHGETYMATGLSIMRKPWRETYNCSTSLSNSKYKPISDDQIYINMMKCAEAYESMFYDTGDPSSKDSKDIISLNNWENWLSDAKEMPRRGSDTEIEGANSRAVLENPNLFMCLCDTFNIDKELNIYMNWTSNGRGSFAVYAAMVVLNMQFQRAVFEEAKKNMLALMMPTEDTDKKVVVTGDSYVEGEVTENVISSKVGMSKKEILSKLQHLRSLKDQLTKMTNTYRREIEKLHGSFREGVNFRSGKNNICVDEKNLKSMLEKGTLKGVRIDKIKGSSAINVLAYFPTIYIWVGAMIYRVGEVAVKISNWGTPNASLSFVGRDTPKSIAKAVMSGRSFIEGSSGRDFVDGRLCSDADAPHVRSHRACLGNISDALRYASNNLNLASYLQFCSRYLHTVNLGDGYGMYISQWPSVPATLHNLVKYGVLASGRITDRIGIVTGSSNIDNFAISVLRLDDESIRRLWQFAKHELDNKMFSTSDFKAKTLVELYNGSCYNIENKLNSAMANMMGDRHLIDHHNNHITLMQVGELLKIEALPSNVSFCYKAMEHICASEHPSLELRKLFTTATKDSEFRDQLNRNIGEYVGDAYKFTTIFGGTGNKSKLIFSNGQATKKEPDTPDMVVVSSSACNSTLPW